MAEANPKKPIFKQIWFWVLILILASGIVFFMEYRGFRGARREVKREFKTMFNQQPPKPQ
jgi:hypothetical protein